MAAGTLTLTCLLLLTCQTVDEIWPMSTNGVRIGIRLDPVRQADIREMNLYVSADRGRSWSREAVAAPSESHFTYYAPRDGEYWFKAVAINKKGQQDPVDVYKGAVDQKVLIDSVPPVGRIVSAERQGEEVVVTWESQDNLPEGVKLKLEHQPAPASDAGPWIEVPIPPQLRGQTRVRINYSAPVVFRLHVRDGGGNTIRSTAEVAGLVSGSHQTFHSGQTGVVPVTGSVPPPAAISSGFPPPTPLSSQPTTFAPPPPPSSGQLAPVYRDPPGQPLRPAPSEQWTQGNNTLPGQPPRPVPVATPVSPPGPPSVAVPGRKPLPPVQIVNNLTIVLDYELARVGPAGLGSVELYVTHDDGGKWHKMAEDDKLDASMKGGKYQRSVELPGEGVYGLAMVVKNKAGRGKPIPRDGDAPEMRIEVDLTRPEGEMYPAQGDPQRAGSLLITWSARDKNLAANPIALEWAERPEGSWQTIHANLPNNGRYSWQLSQGLPVNVFLRLRVRDAAGNEGLFVLNQPALTDLSEPEARLLGVSALRQE